MMMYSFLMFLFGASFLIFIEQMCFWLLFLVMGVLMLGLFFLNMGFTDSVFFPLGMMDLLSFSLIFLSLWISTMMLASSFSVYKSKLSLSLFVFSILVLCLVLVMTFLVSNMILFYFFFEFSLIPTMFIIMGWGYQPERIQAGIYFLFYTLAASLPLLGGVVFVQKTYLVESFFFFPLVSVNFGFELLIMAIFLTAFLVKLPMFFVHLWLPKAHVEAPVSGSMILAGVLLKLGGYGAYRIIPFCLKSVVNYGGYIFGLSIAGMFYVGMLCCRLNDMKALVAYSSVAHMGLVICGLLGFYMWGFSGSLMMMLAHGLTVQTAPTLSFSVQIHPSMLSIAEMTLCSTNCTYPLVFCPNPS